MPDERSEVSASAGASMNARSVRKRLMRGRRRAFWGDRAYLRVRLPASLVPTAPPAVEFPGMTPSVWAGTWLSADESECVVIGQWHCGVDPRDMARPAWEPVYFAEQGDGGGWSYWTGHRERGEEREPLPEATVAQHRAFMAWQDSLTQYGHHESLDAFLDAGYWAKSTRASVDGGALLLEFGVNWRYPKRRRAFCADFARAMKVAKMLGVAARVLKGDGQ